MEKESKIHRKLSSGNIILVGMMGAGKSTMGRVLAKHTGKQYIDSDVEIQNRTGVSIPYIFDVEGEDGFRQRESAVIEDVLCKENIVLATGGGAILSSGNRKRMAGNGIIVYLQASVNELWQRTRHDKNRPLLQTGNPQEKLAELFCQRDPLYMEVADVVIQTGKQNVHGLMLQLVGRIEGFKAEQFKAKS